MVVVEVGMKAKNHKQIILNECVAAIYTNVVRACPNQNGGGISPSCFNPMVFSATAVLHDSHNLQFYVSSINVST
jgi:hypothetical protein